LNGFFHGHGTMRWVDGGYYTGQLVENKKEGKGTLFYPNGDKYDGGWKADNYDGYGKLSGVNGYTYTGDFKAGQKHGKAVESYPEAGGTGGFEGIWENGLRHGPGISKKPDGRIINEVWERQVLKSAVEVKGPSIIK